MERAVGTGRHSRTAEAMVFAFFNWIASLLAGVRNNPERVRKQGLKRIARAIAANAYGKFFRVKSVEATPDLARFFYDIYKVITPAQELLWNVAQSTQLKLCVVENLLDPAQRDMLEKLSAQSLERRAEETEEGLLARQIRDEFDELERSFDTDRTNAINECYSLILGICQFVVYDFYFLLKKFDLQLIEHSFGREPVFSALRGEAVVEELKDFLELAGSLDPGRDWSVPLQVLKELKGAEAVSLNDWNSMLFMIRAPVNSGIFEMIIRFVEKDPDWAWTPRTEQESILGFYLEMIREEIFDCLELVITAKRNILIERHARAVFGNARAERLNYYTEKGGEVYKTKNFPGFVYARGINYLMVFLTDERPEMQSLYELLLIRGQWVSMALSFPLSEALWLLTLFPDRITELDEMLSDWGFYGNRLKTAMMNLDRDKNVRRSIGMNLDMANGEARQIINDAVFNLSVLHDSLQELREDCRKTPGNIIRNWYELNLFSETILEKRIVVFWSKLTNMLELLRILIRTAGVSAGASVGGGVAD